MGVQVYESPKPAPAFALPTLDGRTVRLEDYRGKALLVFFWATW
jgi:peroxiredoxin